ncbi:MAG: tetratricopeptide repeat protein [Clostridiales bacterium]|nr:tetratricopeptide repeat protein [Candidatus Equinaster intestinalis]
MLEKEDYEEFCSCIAKREKSIPVYRILEKLDGYFIEKEFDNAERLLMYWLGEAQSISDDTGRLLLLNECIGFYRKLGKGEKATEYSKEAISFSARVCDEVMKGTTYLNAATAFKAFGKTDDALELYSKAQNIYEKNLNADDSRLAGLYNNMATAVLDKNDFDRAEKLFLSALKIMKKGENTQAEQAITYCNLADLVSKKTGTKNDAKIKDYLENARELLLSEKTPAIAYACEKCEDVFKYYGFNEYAGELSKRAKYERN